MEPEHVSVYVYVGVCVYEWLLAFNAWIQCIAHAAMPDHQRGKQGVISESGRNG